MDSSRFSIKENAQHAEHANAAHREEKVYERPIAGLLEKRMVKHIARPGQGIFRAEMLGKNVLEGHRLLLVYRIQRGQEFDHMILMGLGETFLEGGHE